MTCGIYKLNFNNTNKVYIGKSKDIEARFKVHIYRMSRGLSSSKLNYAYRIYGLPSIEVLVECNYNELNVNETLAIEIFNSVNDGFNTLSLSDEMPVPDNIGENNGMSKFSNTQVIDAFLLINDNPLSYLTDLSKDNHISLGLLRSISQGVNHKWLAAVFPDEYATMLASLGNRPTSKAASDRGIQYPELVSPSGISYFVDNVRQFALLHQLDRGCLNRLLNRKAKQHKGWVLK